MIRNCISALDFIPMRHQNLLILALLVTIAACNKDNDDMTDVPRQPNLETALPLFQITTEVQIENEPKVPAKLEIFENGALTFEHTIGIEYRGSTSYRLSDKKSYGIETWDESGGDVSVGILGLPEEEDWILMGHVFRSSNNTIFDPTLMRHYIGYELFRSMGNYASRAKFVELFINDEYLGVYVFMEKLKRANDRIDISRLDPTENDSVNITGGYILKIDKTAGGDVAPNQPLSYYENNWEDDAKYNADISFRSVYGTDGSILDFEPFRPPYHDLQYIETYFLYEYPKSTEISVEQRDYIQNYIYEFETALLADDFNSDLRTYTDYIDINSFIDYFILNELVRNIDGYRLSTYLFKDLNGKLNLGPVWDLNIGYSDDGRLPINDWIINYNNYVPQDPWLIPFWWDRFLADPVFVEALKARWTSLRGNELATGTVTGLVRTTADYLVETGAMERNYEKWSGISISYQAEIDIMINFLDERLSWMDNEINNL